MGYLIKPFAFGALRDRLTAYREFHERLQSADDLDQREVDRMLETLRPAQRTSLPKGLGVETLEQVRAVLAAHGPSSAGEVGEHLGASRVTARRYLEHLAETGQVRRSTRLGRAGRPEVEYRPD